MKESENEYESQEGLLIQIQYVFIWLSRPGI